MMHLNKLSLLFSTYKIRSYKILYQFNPSHGNLHRYIRVYYKYYKVIIKIELILIRGKQLIKNKRISDSNAMSEYDKNKLKGFE